MEWLWNAADYIALIGVAISGTLAGIFLRETSSVRALVTWLGPIIFFTVVGAVTKAKQDDALRTSVSGGDNYCMITLRMLGPNAYAPQLHNPTGFIPGLRFAFYHLSDGGERAISNWSDWQPCLETTQNVVNEALPEGQYRIDFVASNGVWRQWLRLWKDGDTWMQTTKIVHEKRGVIREQTTTRM